MADRWSICARQRPVQKIPVLSATDGVSESWRVNGTLHREDGPAYIRRHKNGSVSVEEWMIDGNLYREDGGPAKTRYRKDGTVADKEWGAHATADKCGLFYVTYRRGGSVSFEVWDLGGNTHREDGPARAAYRRDGTVKFEEWYINGQSHREDGPASVVVRSDGTLSEIFSLRGQPPTPRELEVIHSKRVGVPISPDNEGAFEFLRSTPVEEWNAELLNLALALNANPPTN